MLIARGAEAILYTEKRNSKLILIKERIKKGYRIDPIDIKLRTMRTKAEVRMLDAARRAGVHTPKVFETSKYQIVMEFIHGERLKELLNRAPSTERIKLARQIGKCIAKLHSAGIIHGDLTTSNMILKDVIYFIDFGLSYFSSRAEDFGEDLTVLYESIKATHLEHLNIIWENILKSYKANFEGAHKALKALEAIERRGRYVKRA